MASTVNVEPVTSARLRTTIKLATLYSAAILGWYYFIGLSLSAILGGLVTRPSPTIWLYDWHVHHAGALRLIDGSLYDATIEVPGWPLPVDIFNLPPAAAAIAVPLLPLGREAGGVIWLLTGLVAFCIAGLLALRLSGVRHTLAVLGVIVLAYAALYPPFFANITLGNINNLMLLLVAIFAWAHLRKRQSIAGIVLGAAISLKLWPAALLVVVVRERRWHTALVAFAVLALQLCAFAIWLGPSVPFELVRALRTHVPVEPGVIVLWTTWARESIPWWPAWAGIATACLALMIPARRRAGIGLGIISGLSLIPNIWDHYAGAFVLAGLLIGYDVTAEFRAHGLRALGRLARVRAPQNRVPAAASDH